MNKIKYLYIIVLLTIFSKNIPSMQQAESQYQESEYIQDSILLNLPDELIISVINQLVIPQVKDIFNNWQDIFQDPKIDLVILKSLSNSSSKLYNLIKYTLKSNSLRGYLNKIKQEKFDILLENLRINSQAKYKDLNQNQLNQKLKNILDNIEASEFITFNNIEVGRSEISTLNILDSNIKNNLINAVELILSGADINTKGIRGRTSLILASEYGYKEIAEILIKAETNVNIKDKQACTDLIAILGNYNYKVKRLINSKANTDIKDNIEGYSALIRLSKDVYKKIVEKIAEMLIKEGADVNTKDNDGRTVLMFASINGHKDIAQILIDKGADVNATTNDGYTALMNASEFGHKDIVEMLIAKGADVNTKDNDGQTVLMFASINGHKDIAQILIAKGADVNTTNNDGKTALMYACTNNNFKIIKMLIQAKANILIKDNDGETALTTLIRNLIEYIDYHHLDIKALKAYNIIVVSVFEIMQFALILHGINLMLNP